MPAGDQATPYPPHSNCCYHNQHSTWYIPSPLTIPPPSDAELRDDFAQAALQGLIASFTEKDRETWQKLLKMDSKRIAQQFALNAYEIADAMMKQRA